MKISTMRNLQKIMDTGDNIACIDIWKNVLYIRKFKGRNVFMSKKGVTDEDTGRYFNLYEFDKSYIRKLQRKYHPDASGYKSGSTAYRNSQEISAAVNGAKCDLAGCDKRGIHSVLSTIFNAGSSQKEHISLHEIGDRVRTSQRKCEHSNGFSNPPNRTIRVHNIRWSPEYTGGCGLP